jgi:hypothetical protein
MALSSATAGAQTGVSVFSGRVFDVASNQPVPDVVVTATSSALQGEQGATTDAVGFFRLANLPPGIYSLRVEKEGFRPLVRDGLTLGANATYRVTLEVVPEALTAPEVVVVGHAPVVDIGSSSTGTRLDAELLTRVPVVRPGTKNSASRTFESVAEIAPSASADNYGVSLVGATSNENAYVIDGVNVNDPLKHTLGTGLTLDFVKEVNVLTGAYLPEYGRANGGVMDVITKSGSNEYSGAVWLNMVPGALTGRTRTIAPSGSSIATNARLWNEGNLGFELGGPLVRDSLWFYVGFAPAVSRLATDRSLSRQVIDPTTGDPVVDERGFNVTEPIADSTQRIFSNQQTYPFIVKATFRASDDHQGVVSYSGVSQHSGGVGQYGIVPSSGLLDNQASNLTGIGNGQLDALSRVYQDDNRDVSVKWHSAFLEKSLLLDAHAGWHSGGYSALPTDGSKLGSGTGLAGRSRITYFAGVALPDVETLADPSVCTPEAGANVSTLCPAIGYSQGGPGLLEDRSFDRLQGRVMGTALLRGLGHHVLKAGLDAQTTTVRNTYAFSGGVNYFEVGGAYFEQEFGYLSGPNQPELLSSIERTSRVTDLGGFAQDSWSILDVVTLNAGVRYDQSSFFGNDGQLGMTLGNQWSPRIGLVYDFAQTIDRSWAGRSKVFANFARYYQETPLDIVDRLFPGQPLVLGLRAGGPGACDPTTPETQQSSCLGANNVIGLSPYANEKTPVDPGLRAESVDEYVLGVEYEVLKDARLGVSYMRRRQNAIIEDLSINGGATFLVGNPGLGLGSGFPKAQRDYDAVTVQFSKRFSNQWLAEASYTWSRLYGNYSGLYRPDTTQLNPSNTSDFDIPALLVNRTGLLPLNRTHNFKISGAHDFQLSAKTLLTVGASYRGRSGAPLNVLGNHPYGNDETFILPRGSGGELPWIHNFDAHVGVTYRVAPKNDFTFGVDLFNVLNSQQVTRVEETYTFAQVLPIANGTPADLPSNGGTTLEQFDPNTGGLVPFDPSNLNPNYKGVLEYQSPRAIRLSAKLTF